MFQLSVRGICTNTLIWHLPGFSPEFEAWYKNGCDKFFDLYIVYFDIVYSDLYIVSESFYSPKPGRQYHDLISFSEDTDFLNRRMLLFSFISFRWFLFQWTSASDQRSTWKRSLEGAVPKAAASLGQVYQGRGCYKRPVMLDFVAQLDHWAMWPSYGGNSAIELTLSWLAKNRQDTTRIVLF